MIRDIERVLGSKIKRERLPGFDYSQRAPEIPSPPEPQHAAAAGHKHEAQPARFPFKAGSRRECGLIERLLHLF